MQGRARKARAWQASQVKKYVESRRLVKSKEGGET